MINFSKTQQEQKFCLPGVEGSGFFDLTPADFFSLGDGAVGSGRLIDGLTAVKHRTLDLVNIFLFIK